MYEYEVKDQELKMKTRMWTAIVIAVVAVIVIGAAVLLPPYNVWASAKAGEAEYVRAEQNRKIKIEEAEAVCFLVNPRQTKSKGVRLEYQAAKIYGKRIMRLIGGKVIER